MGNVIPPIVFPNPQCYNESTPHSHKKSLLSLRIWTIVPQIARLIFFKKERRLQMEIERKYLIRELPDRLEQYPCRQIEQGYLNTDPIVRIRRTDEQYTLTYKGKGFMVREEYNLPLNKKAFLHLREKIDGILIKKRRYLIPLGTYTIELDVFEGELAPLLLAEVEFETEDEANVFVPPSWFGEDVTFSSAYHNSTLSRRTP